MTTNQTIDGVSRELVEWAYSLSCAMGYRADPRTAQLRALLDKEVSGDSRAPQTQGEPVAWLYKERVYASGIGHVWREKIEREAPDAESFYIKDLIPLYTEQPAPVAVVLPDPRDPNDDCDGMDPHCNISIGWNECLDEVTRLNTKE